MTGVSVAARQRDACPTPYIRRAHVNAAGQQAYAAGQHANAAGQQAYAASQQAYAAGQQAYAAGQQAYAAGQQAYAAGQQAYAADRIRFFCRYYQTVSCAGRLLPQWETGYTAIDTSVMDTAPAPIAHLFNSIAIPLGNLAVTGSPPVPQVTASV
ncbi:MAG: hypothetical protein KME26_20055 [Oscillatoria princeps RMCB-10]|nr:hypothetical protein [Oscillatoria princeps RMCB-10]